MRERLTAVWGNLSVQKKLLITMLGLVFSSAFILWGYFFYTSTNMIQTNIKRNIQSTIHQMEMNLSYRVDSINKILFDISTDTKIQCELNDLGENNLAAYEKNRIGADLKNELILKCTREEAVTAVFLTDLDGNVYSTLQQYYPKPSYTKEEIYSAKGANVWMQPDIELEVIPIGKTLYSLENQEALGYLVMYVETAYFDAVFEDVSFSEEDFLFVTDSAGKIIIGQCPKGWEIPQEEMINGTVHSIELDGEERQICSASVDGNDWIVHSVSLDVSTNYEMERLRIFSVIVIFVVLILGVTLVIAISRGISRPIRKLAQSINDFACGDFKKQVDVKYHDEIGQLRGSFNDMAEKINNLINEVYAERNSRQQAQIHALQMQINPHFLYNTLETINWLANEKGADNISEVTRSLGKLMRFSLKKERTCLLEEELDAVRSYIKIQKYRYGEKLHISIRAEEQSLYEMIPLHLLLPLVENAVEHGGTGIQGEKDIWIDCRVRAEQLRISISDNGTGISEEKKKEILEKRDPENSSEHMAIGMSNVQKRLELYYGKEAGFEIKDREGGGTVIVVWLPAESPDLGNEESYEEQL